MTNVSTDIVLDQWFKPLPANPQADLRLFCFPYAGGSAQIFRPWSNQLSNMLEVYPIELPGHGRRRKETPFRDFQTLLNAIVPVIIPDLDKPFAFFGHSMGALIAFELACKLRDQGQPLPSHLFVSGRRAPQLQDKNPPTYNLTDEELVKKLHWLKGTSSSLLDDPEMMQLMLPILRADFTVCETYQYIKKAPLPCPITAFGGWRDPASRRGGLQGWREHTTANFTKKTFPGNHFFLHSAQTHLLKFLNQQLMK